MAVFSNLNLTTIFEYQEKDFIAVKIKPGKYKIELWGAQGGHKVKDGGQGAYTSGEIIFNRIYNLYFYIGSQGKLDNEGGYNGGGDSYKTCTQSYCAASYGGSGGGATDVRLIGGHWNNSESLKSRIMVAAGGGGAEWGGSIGGNGGDIEGGESISSVTDFATQAHEEKCAGAKQTSGSTCPSYYWESTLTTYHSTSGKFGISGIPDISNSGSYGGFGGSGYYGGTSYDYAYAGSGGSSFVSGHKQCNAVKDSETIEHSGDSVHYSGYVFNDPRMIPGNTTMPDPKDPTIEAEYSGTGAFRITLIHYQYHCTYTKSFFRHSIYLFLFIAK